jgi:peptidoglycan/xylan/chitin deacetylase (PgdA/CDA1 family)
MQISLGYHDVADDLRTANAIAQGHTTLYTIDRRSFRDHLNAIAASDSLPVSTVELKPAYATVPKLYFTIDDGAISSYTCIANELERLGWRAHFFITTGWIGRAGFVDAAQIRDLHRRGHLIGSHSCSHPDRMSHLADDQLATEWNDSCRLLSDITGVPTITASVPGGYHSQRVAQAAARAGIRVLFTSEPTTARNEVGDCVVLGRYSVRRNTSTRTVAALAGGALQPRVVQATAWQIKKAIRTAGGRYYLGLRSALLARQN